VRTSAALAPLVLLVVAFEVWCIVDVVRRPPRALARWIWIPLILLSIPLGGILYLVLGRGDPDAAVPGPRADGPAAPAPTGAPVAVGAEPARPRRAPGPPPEGFALRTTELSKMYGDRYALDAVSLDVPRGSVFGMVGPNGAGKTTLLAILAGLRPPTSGTVTTSVPRHKIGLLPDTPHFEPWLTAREVVELSRELLLPDGSAQDSADALEQAGLSDAADRRTGGFSRGMLQRLGLAATIVGRPELLLLDEPCSALDPAGRRDVLDLIGRLGGAHTVLFCSHILDDVQEVCDTVGVLRRGHVLFQGPLDDLLVGRAAPEYAVRVRQPAGPVIEALRAEPWVQEVEQLGSEELRVLATSTPEAERHLAPALAAAGARVVSIVPSGADLERVFLELVR
jgi:ABC-2 type transport system ATP-binding protein